MKRLTVALTCTAALTLLMVPATALGYPQDPYATPVYQQCEGTTEVIVFLHPGAGIALWDITTEDVTTGPNHLIKEVFLDFYRNDVYTNSGHRSFGERVGQGDPMRCTFTETWTYPNGDAGRIEGVSYHTLK